MMGVTIAGSARGEQMCDSSATDVAERRYQIETTEYTVKQNNPSRVASSRRHLLRTGFLLIADRGSDLNDENLGCSRT